MTTPPRPISDLDTPFHVLEAQIAELRAHAEQRLKERGETPSPAHYADWHAFLDIDPDLRGRNYSTGGTA